MRAYYVSETFQNLRGYQFWVIATCDAPIAHDSIHSAHKTPCYNYVSAHGSTYFQLYSLLVYLFPAKALITLLVVLSLRSWVYSFLNPSAHETTSYKANGGMKQPMTEPLYTSGVASGSAQVPQSTLRRYVNDFRKYFSPGAQAERGRRFTQKDIELILLIRRMVSDRFDVPAITEALEKGWDSSQLPKKETNDAIALLAKAELYIQELRQETIKLRSEGAEIKKRNDQLIAAHNGWAAVFKKMSTQLERQQAEIKYLMGYFAWANSQYYNWLLKKDWDKLVYPPDPDKVVNDPEEE